MSKRPYLTPDDPDAFLGMEEKSMPVDYPVGANVKCPKCKGYGGWHLEINAYGPGKHFNASCNNCNGWGWVQPGPDAECCHDFSISERVGNCLHKWTCSKCGRERVVDSSD